MATIERFEDLDAWQLARETANLVYDFTDSGLAAKDFGFRDQIRRAAVSVLSNIAEGFERAGDKEFLYFLSVAKGSCGEARAQLYIALDRKYLNDEQFATLNRKLLETSRRIAGLMKYLRQ